MALKLNVYDMEHEACPECDIEGELTYISNCRACHCGNCGAWVDLDGKILEEE
jgi:succinate dehydrogenase/fumarate reductase-like Fe-S protein